MAKTRVSKAEKLSPDTIIAICEYYKEHTTNQTAREFGLPLSAMHIFLKLHNIEPHSENVAGLFTHLYADGYDKIPVEKRDEIIEFYKTSSASITAEHFNVKKYFVEYLIKLYGITPHTVRDEIKATNKARYLPTWGDGPIRSTATPEEIKEKSRQTKLKKYGDPNYNNREKCKATCLAKYGYENTFQVETFKQKGNETKQARYDDANYTNKQKAAQTCLERYGAETFLASERGQAAIKQYSQEHYGTDFAFQSTEWQKNSVYKQKRYETIHNNKYTSTNYSELYLSLYMDTEALRLFVKDKSMFEIATALGISREAAYYLLTKHNLLDDYKIEYFATSHYEHEIAEYIGLDLCELNNRTVLDGKEIDIYVPSKKIGIEFNGDYWHSSAYKEKGYHLEKSKQAESAGIRLIHIWEYEWTDSAQQEKIKLLLDIALGRVTTRLYARNCVVRQITNTEAAQLNNAIHLQGHRDAQVTYGLFYNDELVQLMSFSHTRYNKNITADSEWEIIRGCPGSNNIVVGGVSKLLAHFIADYLPTKIFSYCDFNKFDGRSYLAAGMKFVGYTGPDMKWLMPDGKVLNRKPRHHAELKELAIAQLFGSGSKKYLWEAN